MSKSKNVARLYLKCLILSIPVLVLGIVYFIKDPFMVLRDYDDYDRPEICQSEGTISWIKYKKYRDSLRYDSFIMGSSCTKAFNTRDWNRYIHARPFRMFCNSEGMGDLYKKLEALDRQPGQSIKNLLIVCERGFFVKSDIQNGVMHVMPPEVSGMSEVAFQSTFLQGFFNPTFLWNYLKYQITHKYDKGMNGVINIAGHIHTRYTNDAVLSDEEKIAEMGENYWQMDGRKGMAAEKDKRTESPRVIFKSQIVTLNKIKAVCERHRTNVKIVIGPVLEGRLIHPADVAVLRELFGSENVLNASDAEHRHLIDYHNFYDKEHYRIQVGRELLEELYRQKSVQKYSKTSE